MKPINSPPHIVPVDEHRVHKKLDPTHIVAYDQYKNSHIGYTSRGHRKMRHPHVVQGPHHNLPLAHKLKVNLWSFEPKNISWWIPMLGFVANGLWVINGFYAMWPQWSENSAEIDYVTGIIGASLFILLAYMGILEVINHECADWQFEYEIEHLVHKNAVHLKDSLHARPRHALKGGISRYPWKWWGTNFHSLAYIANFIMVPSTIIFLIPAIAWKPMDDGGASYGITVFVVWVLQIIPSIGFVLSGYLFMVEASGSWWRPAASLGYLASFLNMIGGWGFLICGIFGIPTDNPDLYRWGSAFSTFWGSWCFFLAGCVTWIEFCSKHPEHEWPKWLRKTMHVNRQKTPVPYLGTTTPVPYAAGPPVTGYVLPSTTPVAYPPAYL